MFKNQLQEYIQKTNLPAPVYETTKEGPSHEPRFKATVTIGNETYESPTYFGNLKKAEHAAAEVALAALAHKSSTGSSVLGPLHESGLCKNILQQYAQRCKLALPTYTLVKSGEAHSPLFNASVKIGGVTYTGGVCKTKKEAEIKAAKTALIAICSDPAAASLQPVERKTSQGEIKPTSAKSKSKNKRFAKNRYSANKRRRTQSNGPAIVASSGTE